MSQRRDTSAPGQALEFEIWSELIKQSRGLLHVFLPLLDRGLDAVLHRFIDEQYIPVQIKGRGELVEGRVQIVVRGDSLVDDDALLIGSFMGNVNDPLDLVVHEDEFRQLATRDLSQGHEIYSAAFSMHPVNSRWRPYLVPRSQLAERILGTSVAQGLSQVDPELLRPSERQNIWLGFLGESETIRRLAENPRLDLFRPYPDLEMVEVLARDNVTGKFAGLQVKTGTVVAPWGEAQIHVRKATLSRAATTWLVCLARHAEPPGFDRECLFVPAAAIPSIATDNGLDFGIHFHPSSPERTRLDPYRKPLAELDRLVLDACTGPTGQPGG